MRRFATLRNNLWVIGSLWRCGRAYVALSVLTSVLEAVDTVVCNALLVRYILDALTRGGPLVHVLVALALTGVLLIVRYALRAYAQESLRPRAQAALSLELQRTLMACARRAPLTNYDEPAFYRDTFFAMETADTRAMDVFNTAMRLFSVLLMTGGFGATVALLDLPILMLPIMYALVSFLCGLKDAKLEYQRDFTGRADMGRVRYAGRVFSLPQYAKELRTTGMASVVIRDLRSAARRLSQIGAVYGKRRMLLMIAKETIDDQLILNIGLYGRLIYRLLGARDIGVGDFLAIAFSAEQVTWRLGEVLSTLPEFVKSSLYIGQMREFMRRYGVDEEATAVNMERVSDDRDVLAAQHANASRDRAQYEGTQRDGKCDSIPCGNTWASDAYRPNRTSNTMTGLSLQLQAVTFSYPGASTPALDGLSLEIHAGEKLAIVGVNGAGKSTLSKLLLGLYTPSSGKILIDGKNIRGVRSDTLRGVIGAVRQDFQIYAATLCENVMMDEASAQDHHTAAHALDNAGLGSWAARLPGGLDHTLTREFEDDGALPSGGEAQKLALSRLFARMPPVCLLDEPSAALDPIAEAQLNHAMLTAEGGRTLILISHRLSTTRFCDRIVLLRGGRVAEQGSHDELMRLEGEYARMFRAQAGRYGGK